MNVPPTSPLIRLLTKFQQDTRTAAGETDFDRLAALIKDALHVQVQADILRGAPDAVALAEALKHLVDHPGRLERLAERLLTHRSPVGAA